MLRRKSRRPAAPAAPPAAAAAPAPDPADAPLVPVRPPRPACAAASKRLIGSSEALVVVGASVAGAAAGAGEAAVWEGAEGREEGDAAAGRSSRAALSGIPYFTLDFHLKTPQAQCRTVNRYSTARSGLKKAARIARSISVLSNPILSMLAMADSRSFPIASAEGSLNCRPSLGLAAGAGDGVAGTFSAVVLVDAAGAGGGAGAEGV